MITHDMPQADCPGCGKPLNACTDLDGENAPKPGDVGICMGCQGLHVFGPNLERLLPTEEDLAGVPLDKLSRYQRYLKNIKERS